MIVDAALIPRLFKFPLAAIALSFLLLCHGVQAQEDRLENVPTDNQDQIIEGWRAELDQISQALQREGISIEELLHFRDRLTLINQDAVAYSAQLKPQIASLTARLSALGGGDPATTPANDTSSEAPQSKGATEGEEQRTSTEAIDVPDAAAQATVAAQALQQEKGELEAQLALQTARLGRTDVIVLRSSELLETVKTLRRQKFTNRLLGRSYSILDPRLWLASVQEVPWLLKGTYILVMDGTKRVISDAPVLLLAAFIISALLTFLALLRVPFFAIVRIDAADAHIGTTDEMNAIKRVMRTMVGFLLIPGLTLFALEQANAVAPRLSDFLWGFFESLGYYAFARGLSLAIFSPDDGGSRLVKFSDRQAKSLHRTIVLCTTIALLGVGTLELVRALVASLDIVWALYGISAMAFSLTAFLSRAKYNRSERDATLLLPELLAIRVIGALVVLSLVVAFFAPLAGFAFLGAFAVAQVIIGGIIAGALFLIFRLLDTFVNLHTSDVESAASSFLDTTGERRVAQFYLLSNGFAKVFLIVIGFFVLSASWGLDTAGIWQDLIGMFAEVQIGELRISPATLLTALVIFALGVVVTRALQRWFANRFLPTTTLDIGLRNSITTGISYAGYVLAAIVAFSQAGLDLSNLAIVAGALSLGIGFGLQSVVSNFVSGIILLAERPIKSGDWIEVGGEQGTVRKISVRSTEIETFDRATVIVPNADFISGSVKNMMYGNTIGRFIVDVGVGYDSDPDQVRDILLDCANNHPLVLTYPESYVVFAEFGASSLDFQLRGYLADCGNGLTVKSDLRFAILKRFREENIEIPFPQRVVDIKGIDAIPFKDIAQVVNEDRAVQQRSNNKRMIRDEIETEGVDD